MSLPAPSLAPAPYAIAFAIEELLQIRSWAQNRDLYLTVALDQVMDGAEFEEMLILSPEGRRRRALTVWRTPGTVYAQTPYGRPRPFESVTDLLESLRPAPARNSKPRGWKRMFRRGISRMVTSPCHARQ